MDIIRESSLIQYFKQEGIEEGERRSTTEAILEVLEIRFDLSEAHPLSTRIAAIDDLQHLKQVAPRGGPGTRSRSISAHIRCMT